MVVAKSLDSFFELEIWERLKSRPSRVMCMYTATRYLVKGIRGCRPVASRTVQSLSLAGFRRKLASVLAFWHAPASRLGLQIVVRFARRRVNSFLPVRHILLLCSNSATSDRAP